MREYELIYIVQPDFDETAMAEVISKVNGWITDAGGEIIKTDVWGKKRMAYLIRKQKEGQYVYVEARIDPTATATLDRNLRFLEPIMRYSLIVRES